MYMRGHARNRGIGSRFCGLLVPTYLTFLFFYTNKEEGKKLSVREDSEREWWKVNEELPQDAIFFFFFNKVEEGEPVSERKQ